MEAVLLCYRWLKYITEAADLYKTKERKLQSQHVQAPGRPLPARSSERTDTHDAEANDEAERKTSKDE